MKLVINNTSKFLVATIVVALVLIVVSTVFIPGVRRFVENTFPDETNYIDGATTENSPKLTCTTENVHVNRGQNINIFSNISALSSTNENLISQLTTDYEKDVAERQHVFVYKVNSDNTNVLTSEINTDVSGNWIVFYILKEGSKPAYLKVLYTVS